MDVEPPPAGPILLQPEEVVTRRSTDLLAIRDEEVARALRYIRENACEGILARDVVRRANVCRASLMRRFREAVGRSILQEIIRVRLDRAGKLLRETNWTLDQIARRTGFKTASRLSRDFKKRLGLAPGAYRSQSRHG